MLFRVLGPLEVRTGGGWTGVGAPKQRAVLAALVLRRGQVVSAERLVDELWAERPPPGARKQVSKYVLQARRLIGDPNGRMLVTRSPGYQLLIAPGEVDAGRFEDLLAAGRDALAGGDAPRAAAALGESLGLWQGPALADVPRGPLVAAEADRLDELRLVALELAAEADLARGGVAPGLEAELRALVAEHPLRERLWHLLMRVLWEGGRPAEALEVYARARHVLAEELGADPAPALQQLYQRILAGDPPPDAEAGVRDAAGVAAGAVHGFPPALDSFVGRAAAVEEIAGLLGQCRLVTISGPGGVGKTRLAGEVAKRVAAWFADGVWLVELAAVQEPALVPAAVAAVLGVREQPGVGVAESLAGVLAREQVLLVLDNCEHVIEAAAQLCGALLWAADDLRVLTTSREPLGLAGEARYRLGPLALPAPGDEAGVAAAEAVVLFADRARRVDPHFTLGGETVPLVAGLVARLDGMPLAIELAAARVESLGLSQLLDRLDDRFGLLAGGDRAAPARLRSLAAAVQWSYQLLGGQERRVFGRVSVFPGPFTLEAAEAVAGPSAGAVVLHLVDCSLVMPPRVGPDGRARYVMLETLRAYGAERLAQAGERLGADAALARYAVQVAEQAAAGLQAGAAEVAAACWLDAEGASLHQALVWAVGHDPDIAVRLAVALAPWWLGRGRSGETYALLRAAAERAARGSEAWCAAHYWLGHAAFYGGGFASALESFTAVRDAIAERQPSPAMVDAVVGRSVVLANIDRIAEGVEGARRALAMARDIGYPAGEVLALTSLSLATGYTGDVEGALAWARQAQRIDLAGIPGWIARWYGTVLMWILMEAGEAVSARQHCVDTLARARQAGDLPRMADCLVCLADLDREAGRIPEAAAYLGEALPIAARTGDLVNLANSLDSCGHLCAATGRWAEAVTIWAANAACGQTSGLTVVPSDVLRRQRPLLKARHALGPVRAQAAEQRGAAMTLATAAEFAAMLTAAMLTAPSRQQSQPPPRPRGLSAREQELVTLVAQGRTDAQIAAQLFISVRTVRSHLDRIRDKTGCRRRADLTRLALQAGLV